MKLVVYAATLDGVLNLEKIDKKYRDSVALFFATVNILGGRVRVLSCGCEKKILGAEDVKTDKAVKVETTDNKALNRVYELNRLFLGFRASGTTFSANVPSEYVPFLLAAAVFSNSETVFCKGVADKKIVEVIKSLGCFVNVCNDDLRIGTGRDKSCKKIKTDSYAAALCALLVAVSDKDEKTTIEINCREKEKSLDVIIGLINEYGGTIKIIG